MTWLQTSRGNNTIYCSKIGFFTILLYLFQFCFGIVYAIYCVISSWWCCRASLLSFELHMVIFLHGGNVTWTSYTPIDHVQWQISNQGLHGRNLFFRYFSSVGTLATLQDTMSSFFTFSFFFSTTSTHVTPSSAIEGRGLSGSALYCCPYTTHTHLHTLPCKP